MKSAARILVVDDAQSFRFLIQGYLYDAGYQTTCVAGGSEALAALEQGRFDLVLSDLVMLGMDGLVLLNQVRRRYPQLPFVLITAHGSIDNAVATMKNGADDYLQKPLKRAELLAVVQRLLEHARLKIQYGLMLSGERESHSVQPGTGGSASTGSMPPAAPQETYPHTGAAIAGSSGAGANGAGRNGFVVAKRVTIPETLPENELFSEEVGAFISPARVRDDTCCRAEGGTRFLDQIGDVLALQPEAPGLPSIPTGAPQLCEREDASPSAEQLLNRFRQHQGRPLPGMGDPIFRTKA